MCKRILVVDDEEPFREIMASILSYEGYQCRCVPSGKDGLKLLETGERFDLITSDIANAHMWGTDFLVEVKRRFPEIRTLVLTGCRDLSESPACVPKGAYDGYLQKPFEREQLSLAVRRAMDPHRDEGDADDA
jgi:two-component system nitrogen regulation response regulator NtrX